MVVKKPAKPLDAIIMDVLDKAVVPKIREDAKAIADNVRQKLVDKITSNGFNFAELSEEYAKRKEKEWPGNPPLIASGDYVNSIVVEETPSGYTIGVSDAVHFGDGQEPIFMRDLARILEYGSPENNIPPRPHWRPAFIELRQRRKEMNERMRKTASERAQKALAEYLALPQVKENR